MDVYGMSAAPDCFPIDDLLDFTDDTQLFSSSTATGFDLQYPHFPASFNLNNPMAFNTNQISNDFSTFNHDLCIPNNDVAELEWLSSFVDESLMHFPTNELAGIVNLEPQISYHGRSRNKRLGEASTSSGWTILNEQVAEKTKPNVTGKKRYSSEVERQVRRCTHCASEKTPQWRTGPLGPKTLCNACGVRYKSGRLVPEYRPAASPTFVLSEHSNSHRKVMELRRQKEIIRDHHHHQQKNFEVC